MSVQAGVKNITIDDVALNLGVSKTTVSRVVSGKGRISNETRARVMAYIEESGYRPNIIAKSLAQSKTYNVCVALPNDLNLADIPFFQNIQLGICEYLAEHDYDVILTTIDNSAGEQSTIHNLVRIISNQKVDAVLLTRTVNDDQAITYLKKQKIPFVTIGSYPDDEVFQVDEDHQNGSCELVSMLLKEGLKRLALFGGNPSYIVTASRKQGFIDAFRKMGLKHPPRLSFDNLLSEKDYESAIETALFEKADCIVCMDDNICEITLRKLAEKKISVPAEIKVASLFGSIILDGRSPSVTCLEFNTKNLGVQAGQKILDIINGKDPSRRTLLTYNVMLKETTARAI